MTIKDDQVGMRAERSEQTNHPHVMDSRPVPRAQYVSGLTGQSL